MKKLKISKEETDLIATNIKQYFETEFDLEIGQFEAEFVMDFLAGQIGHHFYNQGLSDAHSLFAEKAEEMSYLIQELEQQPE